MGSRMKSITGRRVVKGVISPVIHPVKAYLISHGDLNQELFEVDTTDRTTVTVKWISHFP